MSNENKNSSHPGLSLLEVLVVVAIVGLLAAILFPVIQTMRESARRATCASHLRQIGIAAHAYEGAIGNFPASFRIPSSDSLARKEVDGWSAHVLLLPFLEEQVTLDRIDLNATFDENFAPTVNVTEGVMPVSAVRVPIYLCPTEPRDEVRIENGSPRHYPLNYGFNLGKWFVFDPATGEGGSGAFYPNSRLQPQHFSDGLTHTMMAAEVRAWQPYFRNAALAADPGLPGSPADVCGLGGPEFKTESGHTEWVDGRSHQTGFTTVFTPNTKVLCRQDDIEYDIDWTNQQEGKSPEIVTYAAVTARSNHPGIVNVAMMDGSSKAVADDIELSFWRSMSGRNDSQSGE